MKTDFYPTQKLREDIARIVGKYLDRKEYNVFFFGSRVSGKASERSDIDVGIEGPKAVPFDVMIKIKEDIEALPVLYTIEVVDFKKTSADFREVALQYTESL